MPQYRIPNHSINFLTTDILIPDLVVSATPQLESLLERYSAAGRKGFIRGGKAKITAKELPEFMAAISELDVKKYPGGSASNLIRTMSLLGPGIVNGRFIGTTGDDENGRMIKDAFNHARVQLDLVESEVAPQTAISIVIKYPDGERTIVTYPGNAMDIIKPEHFDKELIEKQDHILLQGSIRGKLDAKVTDDILKHRWDCRKQLVLALPTSAFEPEYFYWTAKSANLLVSNTDELGFITGVPVYESRAALEERPVSESLQTALARNIEEALKRLQKLQAEHCDKTLEKIGFGPQVAMITDGVDGAYLVTSSKIDHVKGIPDYRVIKTNKLGAGDNSFAFFIFAKTVMCLSDRAAINFAMIGAASKLEYDGPVMENPMETLRRISPAASKVVENMTSAGQSLLNIR